jgi:hypothetical protein
MTSKQTAVPDEKMHARTQVDWQEEVVAFYRVPQFLPQLPYHSGRNSMASVCKGNQS